MNWERVAALSAQIQFEERVFKYLGRRGPSGVVGPREGAVVAAIAPTMTLGSRFAPQENDATVIPPVPAGGLAPLAN